MKIHELQRLRVAYHEGGFYRIIINLFIYIRVIFNLIIRQKAESISFLEERKLFERIIKKQKPKIILEIGTAKGGMLQLFCKNAPNDAIIISIDLPNGEYGGGYPLWMGKLYKKIFPKQEQQLELIRGNSHNQECINQVKKILNGRKIDFLFIDGDHTYIGAKTDFENFIKLMNISGIIAFHDINSFNTMPECRQVDIFWQDVQKLNSLIEAGAIFESYIFYPEKNGCGVGIIYLC